MPHWADGGAPTRRAVIAGAAVLPLLRAVPAAAAAARPILLRDADWVLTMRDGEKPLPRASVLIQNGVIAGVGANVYAAGAEEIDARGTIVLPGFVDTHWHLWNSFARGLAVGRRFTPVMTRYAPRWTPADSALGVQLGLAEAVNSGITTVHDWAHNVLSPAHAEAELAALRAAGVRGRFGYGYPNALAPDRVMDLAHLETLARGVTGGLVDMGVVARGPDRSATETWQAEWRAARRLGLPISTHMASDLQAARKGGVGQLARFGGLGRDVLLVHMTAASREAMTVAARGGSPVSISPWTELEAGYGVPPVGDLAAAGLWIGLSVDNLVLSGAADMFAVMKLTADLAGGPNRQQSVAAPAAVLEWATSIGARTLGLSQQVGTLAPGYRADVIAVRADTLGTAGADPVAALTHGARPGHVDTVLIDGAIHKRGGKLTRVDAAALARRAAERARALLA